MADTPGTAQNKMGELFVDFGFKGGKELLSALNGISANFSGAKKAAEAFITPFKNVTMEAGRGAIAWEKWSKMTGFSRSFIADVEAWAKINDVDFSGFMNQFYKLQQMLTSVKLGQSPLPTWWVQMGLPSAQEIDTSEQGMRKLFGTIYSKLQQIKDPATKALITSELGLSPEILYSFSRMNELQKDTVSLTDNEIQNLEDLRTTWKKLGVTAEYSLDKILSKNKLVIDGLKFLTDFLRELPERMETGVFGEKSYEWAEKAMKWEEEHIPGVKAYRDASKAWDSFWINVQKSGAERRNGGKPVIPTSPKTIQKNKPVSGTTPETYIKAPTDEDYMRPNLPPELMGNASPIINVTQNITGTNSEIIARNSARNIREEFGAVEASSIMGV